MNENAKWKRIVLVSLIAITFALTLHASQPAAAMKWHLIFEFCIQDILLVEIWNPPIVVGCEVVDCCPGCPGPGLIDWRILFESDPVMPITFQFENLSPENARLLDIKGEAKWVDENNLQLGRGEIFLGGFGAEFDERPPAAIPMFDMDEADIEEMIAEAERVDRGDIEEYVGSLHLNVEQLLGPVVVNEYEIEYLFRNCREDRLPIPKDKIYLDNNADDDDVVVLLDANRGNVCVDDQIHRDNDVITFHNVLAADTCNSEIAVFSDDDAMQLVTPTPPWTDYLGDTVTIDLTPDLLQAPATVWLLMQNVQPRAQADVAQANNLFNTSNCGVGFGANYQNQAANPVSVNLVGTVAANMCAPVWLANLQGSAIYNAGQLNVYYVNGAFTALNCIADRNVVVVGTTSNNQSLAHEIGHSYSLGHTNGLAGFPNTNVMIGGGAGRTEFTEGQCFRVNLNPGSALNTNGVRAGTTRNCPDGTTSDTCPALSLDVNPN